MQVEALIADKAFDPDKRVREPLVAAGKTAMIPSTANRGNSPNTTSTSIKLHKS